MPCTKIRYESVSSARAAIAAISKRRGDSGKTERAFYGCSECGCIHLTSQRVRSGPLARFNAE